MGMNFCIITSKDYHCVDQRNCGRQKRQYTFDDMFMSGDALSICQAVKANRGKVIVQVDRLVDTPSRPRNAIIPAVW